MFLVFHAINLVDKYVSYFLIWLISHYFNDVIWKKTKEPKPEKEIKEFIKQYDVTFDMFAKINVNGGDAHPLYKYLKSKVDGTFGSFIKWNFSKFLINKEGVPVKRYCFFINYNFL